MKASTWWLLHRVRDRCERDPRCRWLAQEICMCGGISHQKLWTAARAPRRRSVCGGDCETSPWLVRLMRRARVHGVSSALAEDSGCGAEDRSIGAPPPPRMLKKSGIGANPVWVVRPEKNGPAGRDETIARVVNILQQQQQQEWGRELEKMVAGMSQVVVTEVLKQQSDVETALKFFRWVESRNSLLLSCAAHTALLKLVCKCGKFEEVDGILKRMRARRCSSMESAFTTVITGYGKARKVEEAVGVLDSMAKLGCAPNVITYNCVMNRVLECGGGNQQHATCVRVFEKMQEAGCAPDAYTYTCMMHSFARQGDVESAEKLFKEMKERKGCGAPNALTYSALIQGFAKCSRVAEAWWYLEDMKAQGIDPPAFCYGVLLSAVRKEKLMAHAEDLFEEMKERGIVNVFAYNVMLDGYGKSGEPDKAVELLEEMRRAEPPSKKKKEVVVAPDACTYNTVIGVLVKARRLDEARRYLDAFEAEVGHKPGAVAYNSVIDGLLKRPGREDEAVACWEEMKARGVAPDACTYHILIDGLDRADRRAESQAMFAEMQERRGGGGGGGGGGGTAPTTRAYNILIRARGTDGDVAECARLFAEMKRAGVAPDRVTYNTLMDAYGKAYRTRDALKLLGEMQAAGVAPDVVTYSTLVDAAGKACQAHHARRLFREMRDRGVAPNLVAYNAYIDALGCAGYPAEACVVFQDMKRRGVAPNVVTYTTLMNWLAHAGEKVLVCRLFEDMEKSGCCPDELTFEVLGRGNDTRSYQLVNWKYKVPPAAAQQSSRSSSSGRR